MIVPSQHDQRIWDVFKKTRLLFKTSVTQWWEIVDHMGHQYVAKMVERHENGEMRRSFTREYNVFFALTEGSLQYFRFFNGITPPGFSNIFFADANINGYDVTVTEFLPTNVFSLRNERRWNGNLSVSDYLQLAIHMLRAVQKLHCCGFVHRNVKPQNFRISEGFIPYLVNFSDAQYYNVRTTCTHYSEGEDVSFTGTLKYASLNAHRLKVQSRRDDMISLGYSIIDIMKKGLPWDGVSAGEQDSCNRNDYIQSMKESTFLWKLCSDLPRGINQYMLNVTSLPFKKKPDYDELAQMLKP